jgi:site-specific recombinase XerD
VLWRAGLRVSEALALAESDLEVSRGSMLVRRGKGGRRREIGMDEWAWDQLRPWLETRVLFPVGPLVCVINGPTRGGPWSSSQVRIALRRAAAQAGGTAPLCPHQLRHAHAVEMAREGVLLNVIQRQLGHANLAVTSIYLQGIDSGEIIETVRSRRAPMIPARGGTGSLALFVQSSSPSYSRRPAASRASSGLGKNRRERNLSSRIAHRCPFRF